MSVPKPAGKKAVQQGLKLDGLPKPQFWKSRQELFDQLYAAQQAKFQADKKPIQVQLPDGKKMDMESWVNSPLDVAKKISNSLADKVVVSKVNGVLWDLHRPLEDNCSLELLDWEEPEARKVFWHSSAHVLGYGLERVYGIKLVMGPPLEEGGFFYEGETKEQSVHEADYDAIQKAMGELVKAKVPFQRLVVTKEDALKMFDYNQFKKITLGGKVPAGGSCTVYKCGDLIDPCKGPHIPDTGRVKAFKVTKNSSSYFQGDAKNPSLQRVYCMSFPKDAQLKEWEKIVEEAAKRDHRLIGKHQDLFHFNEVSPGSAFWAPHGARIYNTLIEFQRKQYRKRGFEEVVTPNIYNKKLWEVSGHWALYKDNMFTTICEHEEFGLKPMNCPGHCMMFASRPHSYKELPIRYADFGVLHRNELSGALTGLTRVRRFQQDDAHIFCRLDQIGSEMFGALDFLQEVYGVFGFRFYLKLSTMPDNALGEKAMWEDAEANLARALNDFCGIPQVVEHPFKEGEKFIFDGTIPSTKLLRAAAQKGEKAGKGFAGAKHAPWELNAGDGAFYGPKIDITVEDALKRRHQCATIQLDFNLPNRFGLKYTLAAAKEEMSATATSDSVGEDSKKAPPAEEKKEALAAEEKKEAPAKEEKKEEAPAKEEKKEEAHVAKHVDPVVSKDDQKESNEADAKKDELKEKQRALMIDSTLDPNQERPVIIHRAIFGSLERCIAILCEHYGGKWPFWLSPRQAVVIPVAQGFEDYAKQVKDRLWAEEYWAEIDLSSASLEKKIRNAQLAQYNFILVVGEDEVKAKSVNVRTRDNQRHGTKTLDDLEQWFYKLKKTYDSNY